MADESAVSATVKSWRAVYPGVDIIYTGGVTLENVGRLARDDPQGIFCGSAVAKQASDPVRMQAEAQRWLAAIAGASSDSVSSREAPTADSAHRQPPGDQKAVVTFGEIMLRLSPPQGQRFRKTASFDATYGGAEANVAASLAQWGIPSRYVSAVPDNDLGQAAIDSLRSLGVGTTHVTRCGDRIGIYFLEHGASQRASRVIYDRTNSAIAGLDAGTVDWPAVFAGAGWFHWTGITPALSEATAAATAEAVRVAKDMGLTVSVDLNYRSKLWSRDRARRVMTELVELADVVVANESDAADVFGITAGDTDLKTGRLDLTAYRDVAQQLVDRFGLRLAAITLRESHSASENTWSACVWDGSQFSSSTSYRIRLVDRVGGGDAFSAGLIYSLLSGRSASEALEFGVAASCIKQTVMGDFNIASLSEVEALAGGDVAGRISR
jgi:2-dehydro-3-deoxygluconokinase